MKQIILLILPLIHLACSNDFDSKLRGQWQLRNVEINGHDSIPPTPVYYCFQNQVFQIKRGGSAYGRYYMKGDSLCVVFEDSLERKKLVKLNEPGWSKGFRSFVISKLNDDQLHLNSKEGLMKFRIY